MHAALADVIYVPVAALFRTGAYEQVTDAIVATIGHGHVSGVLLDLDGVRTLDDQQLQRVLSIVAASVCQGVETRIAGVSAEIAGKLSAARS